MARRHRPDVAVLDLQMPGLDGIAVAEAIAVRATRLREPDRHQPRQARAPETGVGRRCRRVVPKTVSAQVLADVIRTVHGGGRYVDPQLAAEAISAGDSPLTSRETDVLELAAGGCRVEDIAQRAALSPGTVRNYLSAAATKLGAANRHEAVQKARMHGWI